jgi:hypothetical protein
MADESMHSIELANLRDDDDVDGGQAGVRLKRSYDEDDVVDAAAGDDDDAQRRGANWTAGDDDDGGLPSMWRREYVGLYANCE